MIKNPPTQSLEQLKFTNRFTTELPADPSDRNVSRQVMGAAFSRVKPTATAQPQLVAHAREVAAMLGIDEAAVDTDLFTKLFSGNALLDGMDSFAMCYGGHQFGNWAGQLGDGRAINLGEIITKQGEHFSLQLKGSGRTPYSRTADGRAVLRSSIREFLCSEAMYHLGVPTTRALSLTLTGDQVMRDILYNGNPALEFGAVVCRVSPSFTRFGNFQIFASRQEDDVLKQLVDFTLRNDFPHIGEPSKEAYVKMFHEVCEKTADMILHWMRIGFVHGVMNTDNMSILGLTIDYGPYGFLDNYDPNWTPNTTDAGQKRYRYGQQPQIAQWNLMQLANALYPLIEEAEPLQAGLELYANRFQYGYPQMLMDKLGLGTFDEAAHSDLITELQKVLVLVETDMTIFFRKLADVPTNEDVTDEELFAPLQEAYYEEGELTADNLARINDFLHTYAAHVRDLDIDPATRRASMNATNPKYLLRNYLAQLAIDAAENGDFTIVNELLDVMRNPYDEQPEHEAKYAAKRPDWARTKVGCSMLSCSS